MVEAMVITASQLLQIMPSAGEQSEVFAAAIARTALRHGISTPTRLAAFLAQIGHETNGLTVFVEDLNYSASGLRAVWPDRFDAATAAAYGRHPEMIANRAYANRMGNGDEASGDGWRFRGRGLLQISGRSGYGAASNGIGLDLIYAPEQLERPEPATDSAGWFWAANGLNALADAGDFDAITKRINGGLNGLADRRSYWARAKVALGVSA